MNDESRPKAAPEGSGGPAEQSTVVDAVYSYDACDLQDMAHPYSGVHVQGPPLGALVRINIGKDHDLISSGEMNAIKSLAYGARRVQIEGQNHNVAYVVRELRQYLDEMARVEARQEQRARQEWAELWGEPA